MIYQTFPTKSLILVLILIGQCISATANYFSWIERSEKAVLSSENNKISDSETCRAKRNDLENPSESTGSFPMTDGLFRSNALTYIPDDKFEQALIDMGYDNVLDNYVRTTNIASVTILDLNGEGGYGGITSLTGIEDFIGLETLILDYQYSIPELDLRNNINLREVWFREGSVTSIDVTGLTNLRNLDCENCRLSSLDLSTNTALNRIEFFGNRLTQLILPQSNSLTSISVEDNNLSKLDVSGLPNLSYFVTVDNPNLSCIKVSQDQLSAIPGAWYKNAYTSYLTNCDLADALTYIPDDKFEQALIDMGYDDVLDNYVRTTNIASVTILDLNGEGGYGGITSLTGIEGFIGLETLILDYQYSIPELDLRNNINLREVWFREGSVTSIDVTGLTNLRNLDCENCRLSSLDLSTNTALNRIEFFGNRLTQLILPQSNSLTSISVEDNNLSKLDVSGLPNLSYFVTVDNPNLSCVKVSQDQLSAIPGAWYKNAYTSYLTNCSLTYIPDDKFEQALVNAGHDDVLDNYVWTANIENITRLDLNGETDYAGLADLTGLEDFVGLEELRLEYQYVEVVDVTSNVKLKTLYYDEGGAEVINVTGLVQLERLDCTGCHLNTLDLSTNTNLVDIEIENNHELEELLLPTSATLTRLDCYDCNLSALDVSGLPNLRSLDVSKNPDLYCIQVNEDQLNNIPNNWIKNAYTSYLTNCDLADALTYIPDDKFEQALVDAGRDDVLDNYVWTANIENITRLDLNGETDYAGLADLTGLEDFVDLEELRLEYQYIEVVDVTSNVKLKTLYYDEGGAEVINVTGLVQLERLDCTGCHLNTLDLSTNTNLVDIEIENNHELEELLLPTSATLTRLDCYDCNLSALDVSGLPNLRSLDVSKNPNLHCIQVNEDQLNNIPERWYKDNTAYYSTMRCDFVTTWKTNNAGSSANNQITIPTIGGGYNYDVQWTSTTNPTVEGTAGPFTGNATITFPSAGTYQLTIAGSFPRIYFNNSGDREKLLSVDNWGDNSWNSMNSAFKGCVNLRITAADAPNLRSVTDMSAMFANATGFNDPIGHWSVGNTTKMDRMFQGASSFNQPINSWDISRVESMQGMFAGAVSFNQNLGGWDMGHVVTMSTMFEGATRFNQNLGHWNLPAVESMQGMLDGSGMNVENYDKTLIGWASNPNTSLKAPTLGAQGLRYCTGQGARQQLLDRGWNILGDMEEPGCILEAPLPYTPLYNGNISAILWKGAIDKQEQVYTYQYDELNRLTQASYYERVFGNYAINRNDYAVPAIGYDLNGNIIGLSRNSQGTGMDILTYDYGTGAQRSNQLLSVRDAGLGTLGFRDGNNDLASGQSDYDYDDNGNMSKDLNKGITRITYNYLNLPDTVTKTDGSYIRYIYDATGVKLAQEVYDATHTRIKQTKYMGEFIYENDEIALVQHEEGRIVPDPVSGGYDYEYYLKDHLGNTRVVFTTNPKEIDFTLNYESSAANPDDEGVFTGLDNIIEANVHDHTDAGSIYQRSQRLIGTADAAIGSVLTIPVGAGDRISASVYAKYLAPTATNTPGVAIGALLAAAINGGTGGTTYEGAINSSYGPSGSMITNLFDDQVNSTEPMAFLNLLFLPGEGASSIDPGQFTFRQIGSASSNTYALLTLGEPFEAPRAGYVVVYLSNESEVLTEVYFDDLEIVVNEHPVVQTADYYPFGLTFNSFERVTAKENRYKFNQGTGDKKFLTERITDLGLNWDMTKFRTYDYTLGRFMQIDPLADARPQESWTPYQFAYNNPIRFNDPYGDCPACWQFVSDVTDFANGMVNAIASNNTTVMSADGSTVLVQGFSRESGGAAFSAGQAAGDIISVVQGAAEAVAGATVATGGTIGGVVTSPTGVGAVAGAAVATGGVVAATHGVSTAKTGLNNLLKSEDNSSSGARPKRSKNRLPDKGEPNTVKTNKPGTTMKKYGPDGNVQKEFNKGHQGNKIPKNERRDHIHDYKPNPHNPSGRGDRMPGRAPKRNELKKDFNN